MHSWVFRHRLGLATLYGLGERVEPASSTPEPVGAVLFPLPPRPRA